ncbi:MAG: UDP-glucose 4-epimerase GalE [Actinomycetales bacterium]
MTWLITGGAGFIGAHVVAAMRAAGESVVVLDDLSTGNRESVPGDVPFVEASVLDLEAVRQAMRDHEIDGVVHIAAKKQVGESVDKPLAYYWENVEGLRRLLQACVDEGVDRFLFSSSAAVYGNPPVSVVEEDTPCAPESPYGETKLIGEWLLRDVARAHGLKWLALRYFNVAGAAAPELGDPGVFNLIPMVFERLTDGKAPLIFGDDYPTPDGTCIRDYIHVADIASAHVAAAEAIRDGRETAGVLNIGRGEGVSVREVVDLVLEVTGRIDVDPEVVGRRAGDPAAYAASGRAIRQRLGWAPQHDLQDMVSSAWAGWVRRHPDALR